MQPAERFEEMLAGELVGALRERMSPGDRADCYAIELLFYPDQNPFEADVEIVACSEKVLRAWPNFSEVDFELRWNHAALTPDGDITTIPATAECQSALRDWHSALGVRPEWVSGDVYPDDAEGRAENDRLAEVVTVAFRQMLVRIVQALHSTNEVEELFGKPIPLIISHLNPAASELIATVEANGIELSGSFLDYLVTSGVPGRNDPMVQAADQRFKAATTQSH